MTYGSKNECATHYITAPHSIENDSFELQADWVEESYNSKF